MPSAIRPGDVLASLADHPYEAALLIAERIEELRRLDADASTVAEIARLRDVVRELMDQVKTDRK